MSNDQSLQAQLRDAIARGDRDALKALMSPGSTSVSAKSAMQNSAIEVPAAVRNALQQGNLIEAIQRLRETNPGLSLKAAKAHVETLGARVPVKQIQRTASTFNATRDRMPTVVMGDKPGGLRWLFVLIVFLALVVWWWSKP